MQAVVSAKPAGATVAAVISNQADAPGLAWAAAQGLTTASLNHRDYACREDYDVALMALIDGFAPDLVLLAGFMRILTPAFCQHYAQRLINIHPSLLPAFTGLDTHARAIEAGCRVAGCTVHFVTPSLDCGPIIRQAVVPVLSDDTPQTLAERVLALEHQILPQAVADFVAGRLHINGQRVVNTDEAPMATLNLVV